LRQHAMRFALKFASFKDNIRVYNFIQTLFGRHSDEQRAI